MFEQELLQLGFTKNAARVYVALLETGNATASQLTNTTGVKRSSVYVALEQLERRGLIEEIASDRSVSVFKAAPPQQLAAMVRGEYERQRSALRSMEELLPNLEALGLNKRSGPEIRIYTGERQLLRCYKQIARKSEEVFRIITIEGHKQTAKSGRFLLRIIKRVATAPLLYKESTAHTEVAANVGCDLSAIFDLEREQDDIQQHVLLGSDFISFIEPDAAGRVISIHSREFAAVFSRLFDASRDQAVTSGKPALASGTQDQN
jgi:sugar-specific transcriptional regulator TrmB